MARRRATSSGSPGKRTAERTQPRAGRQDAAGHPLRPARATDQLARARKLCLALPETTEKIAWGAPTFRVKGKLFAMYAEDHHGDGRVALWCAAAPGAQVVLCTSEPKRFFVPPYVGKSGWVGVHLAASTDAQLARIVRDAWRRIAPPKIQHLVRGED